MEKLVSDARRAAEGVQADAPPTPEELAAMAQWADTLSKDPELLARYQELQKVAQELDLAQKEGKLNERDVEKMEQLMSAMDSLTKKAETAGDPQALQDMIAGMMGSSCPQDGERDSLKLPGDQKLGPDGVKKNEVGIDMVPEPGFVVKTNEMESKTKIFINICQSDLIGEPEVKKKLDNEGNEVEGLNVPVSVGQARPVKDNAGKGCVVYDCVMNPKVLADAKEDKTGAYRDFLCQLSIEYVESKYKCKLDRRYKLPKTKYKGDIATQRVRDIKKIPKIEEVSSTNAPPPVRKKGPVHKKPPEAEVELRHMDVKCFAVDSNGEEKTLDILDISEPSIDLESFPAQMRLVIPGTKCTDPEKMSLQLSCFSMTLQIPGFHKKDIVMPFPAKDEGVIASLIPTREEINILIDVDHSGFDNGPDPGSRLWMLQHALSDGIEEKSESMLTSKKGSQVSEPVVDMNTPWHEDDELPEDKFHKKDMISQHHMNLQETGRREKHEKFEREREERKNEENVEYIDPADYREGGKYGPPDKSKIVMDDGSTELLSQDQRQILQEASNVVLARMKEQKVDVAQVPLGNKLSSSLWSELLD